MLTAAVGHGIARAIDAETRAAANRVYLAPAGTPFDGTPDEWQTLGFVSTDGFELDKIGAESWHRANPPINPTGARHARTFTFRFQIKKRAHRRIMRLMGSPVYRFPGERPLIHKGKKARR